MVDEPKHGALVGVRVLVVEDHEDSRDILPQVLAFQGALVTTAASAREALDMVDPWRLCEEIHTVLEGRPGD
jgi:CheY-like chemotaxis protein